MEFVENVCEKEYTEFVSLLKLYVNSEESKIDLVHLVYHNEESILLDKDKNVIKTDINLLNATLRNIFSGMVVNFDLTMHKYFTNQF